MNFKSTNFYIVVIDLFAIVLPGAIATLVLYQFFQVEFHAWIQQRGEFGNFLAVIVFLLSAYLLGHVISQLSATMDSWLYDALKDRIFTNRYCLDLIERIRGTHQPIEEAEKYLSSFEWARTRLFRELPEAVNEIERYLADSKFFRGLVLIFALVSALLFTRSQNVVAVVSLLLAIFSLISYFHQRRRATESSYKYVIFLENRFFPNGDDANPVSGETQPATTPTMLPDRYRDQVNFLSPAQPSVEPYFEINSKSNWQSPTPIAADSTISCLSGKGWLLIFDGAGAPDERIWMSPNCYVVAPHGSRLYIENTDFFPLSLIAYSEK